MQIGVAQAKARLSELTALVDAGHEVVIAKHGRPSYRLLPVSAVPAAGALVGASAPVPNGLGDMASLLTQTRSKTRPPKTRGSFVAQMRKNDRY